jgi:hypothetical protein
MTKEQITAELDKLFGSSAAANLHVNRLWELWEACGKLWQHVPPRQRGQVTRDEALDYARRLCPGYRDPREVDVLRREVAHLRKSVMECNMEEMRRLRQEVAELKEQSSHWYCQWQIADIRARSNAPAIPEHYATLHLLPSAPAEVVNAAHKALVNLHHPDRGGDMATMQAINAAVDHVRREKA